MSTVCSTPFGMETSTESTGSLIVQFCACSCGVTPTPLSMSSRFSGTVMAAVRFRSLSLSLSLCLSLPLSLSLSLSSFSFYAFLSPFISSCFVFLSASVKKHKVEPASEASVAKPRDSIVTSSPGAVIRCVCSSVLLFTSRRLSLTVLSCESVVC